MSLSARIETDLRAAMKARNNVRTQTLRTLIAAMKEKAIDLRGKGSQMSPDDEISVLMTASKKRKESIDLFGRGGRQDLVEQESRELEIINEYLPRMMGETEIAAEVDRILDAAGPVTQADFGRIMGLVMKDLKGKADGKLIQETVRKRIDASAPQ